MKIRPLTEEETDQVAHVAASLTSNLGIIVRVPDSPVGKGTASQCFLRTADGMIISVDVRIVAPKDVPYPVDDICPLV